MYADCRRAGTTKRSSSRRAGRTSARLVGYLRHDTPAAVAALNDLYRHELRLFQNLFLPFVKLCGKQRICSRVRRRYDAFQTPIEHLWACADAASVTLVAFTQLRARLDPFRLSQAIDHKLKRVVRPRDRDAPPRARSRRAAVPSPHAHRPPSPAPRLPAHLLRSSRSAHSVPPPPGGYLTHGAMIPSPVTSTNGLTGCPALRHNASDIFRG